MVKAERITDMYMDYEILENMKCLEEKELIIYGAGSYGREAAVLLHQLGFLKFDFCDKDIYKHGMRIMGCEVLSVCELEERTNLLFIIAVKDKESRREIENTLSKVEGAVLLSFFALKTVWKYFAKDYTTIESKAETLSFWYEHLRVRANTVADACKYPVVVYQNGKVASSTIKSSLWHAGIKNAHIHRFFFLNDMVGKLILGEEEIEFIKSSNIFRFKEYVKYIKDGMKHKKIITMVRDPIAVNLSTVFQWIGRGNADKYFSDQLRKGATFSEAVVELMLRIKNRLFDWFNEELKEMYGIDVFDYPFDREKGYVIISENTVEILLLKTEKLSQMAGVIGNFIDNDQFELFNENVGNEKEYSHIYKRMKEKLELPKDYIEYYYKNNLYMDHFYTKEEQNKFLLKWMKYTSTPFL